MSDARWMRVGPVEAWPDGSAREVRVLARSIAVFCCGGRFWAVDGLCRHMHARLVMGKLDGVKVTCSRHGWTYDVTDGTCKTGGEEWARLRTYALKQEAGVLYVDAAPIYREQSRSPD